MLTRNIRLIGGSILVLLLGFLREAAAQKFSLTDVKSSRVGGIGIPGAKRAMLFYAERPRRDTTILRQYWLDEQMRLRHKSPLLLRGPYVLQALIRSRQHVLYQFKRRSYDTLVSIVVDTTGRTVAVHRERQYPRRLRDTHFRALDIPKADGFVLVEPGARRSARLLYRTPTMRQGWEIALEPQTQVVAADADSTHLWVIIMRKQLSRHPASQAVCLDLQTGKEIGRYAIGPPRSAWVPAIMHIGSNHELLLAGYAFNRAASRTRTGDLFYMRLTATGQQITQRRTTLARTNQLRAARGGRVYWTLLQPDAQGNVRLVGETFQSSSYGAVLLRTSLSFGLLQYSVLRPRDIISLTLDTTGQVQNVRMVALRQDRGSFVWPGYVPGRILAGIAAQFQTFRYRGIASQDNNMLVLRSPQQIQTLNLATQQLISMRQKPPSGEVDVWHVGSDFMLIYQQDAAKRTLEVERVAIERQPSGSRP